jgi:hypothetical protein
MRSPSTPGEATHRPPQPPVCCRLPSPRPWWSPWSKRQPARTPRGVRGGWQRRSGARREPLGRRSEGGCKRWARTKVEGALNDSGKVPTGGWARRRPCSAASRPGLARPAPQLPLPTTVHSHVGAEALLINFKSGRSLDCTDLAAGSHSLRARTGDSGAAAAWLSSRRLWPCWRPPSSRCKPGPGSCKGDRRPQQGRRHRDHRFCRPVGLRGAGPATTSAGASRASGEIGSHGLRCCSARPPGSAAPTIRTPAGTIWTPTNPPQSPMMRVQVGGRWCSELPLPPRGAHAHAPGVLPMQRTTRSRSLCST